MFSSRVVIFLGIFGICFCASVPEVTEVAGTQHSPNFRVNTEGSLLGPGTILENELKAEVTGIVYNMTYLGIYLKAVDDKEWIYAIKYATIINSFGYPAETHYVTTEDGYILQVHRIQHDNRVISFDNLLNAPAVLLMHGLSMSSEAFVTFGPNISLAYHLVDAGYDVWIGNSRGNINSRNHTTLDPDHQQEKFDFFDFSFEEIGMYDIPATVDFILEYTGKGRLHYIGHSQGGTAFLVLNSLRPEYNRKFTSAHLLAGVGYMEYFPDEELKELSENVDMIYLLARLEGIVELIPAQAATYTGLQRGDKIDQSLRQMCKLFSATRSVERNTIEEVLANLGGSGGASVKQYAHYGQNIKSKLFRRWDHGSSQNSQIYGTQEPPVYNLSLITVQTVMHYSLNDYLLDERDVLAMERDMPNAIIRKVARDSFGHSEYLYAVDAKELVTDYIIDSIIERENTYEEEEEELAEENIEVDIITDANTSLTPSSSSRAIFSYLTAFIITGIIQLLN